MTRTTWRILFLALGEDADLYQVHDPELVPVGLALKAAGHRVIWDVHEDLPKQVLQKEWIAGSLRGMIARVLELGERVVVRAFDAVVAATPAIADRYLGHRTLVINNYPRLADLEHALSDNVEASENAVVYTGSITRIRGVLEIVKAVDEVADTMGIRLAMAGRFSPPDLGDRLADRPEWRHVDFHGWLPQEELFALLGRSLAGLLLFQPAPNHVQAQPNKLFEYMAAGLPIIASDFPLWRNLIEKEVGCGIVVDPTEPGEIADAIRWIASHGSEAEEMGRRGSEAVRTEFNWESEQEKLLRLYSEILDGA
jgi:glycosyltransferase involved in cell wall biosynthesis